MAGDVTFVERALSHFEVPAGRAGWVVTNPPYGKRVGESGALRDLWARLGDVLRVACPAWRVALLGPDPQLERQLRLPLSAAVRTNNGGIPVHVLTGTVPGGAAAPPGAAADAPDDADGIAHDGARD